MWRGDVLGERLDEERLADHDLVDRLAEELREARHVHAFLARIEVDRARDLGGERLLVALVPDADRLLHAGARRPASARAGSRATEACRSPVGLFRVSAIGYNRTASMPDSSFPRLVSLACHDLRTPLATVYGFARTLTRAGELDERSTRFVAMIEEASEQMAELLDELGHGRAHRERPLGARVPAGGPRSSSPRPTTSGSRSRGRASRSRSMPMPCSAR